MSTRVKEMTGEAGDPTPSGGDGGADDGRGVCRCVCRDVPLTEVLRVVRTHPDATPGEVMDLLGMGDRCGMCIPYVEAAISTGRSCFSPDDPFLVPLEKKVARDLLSATRNESPSTTGGVPQEPSQGSP
jgi:bacterioferritin-associated ferredoxin